MKQIFSKKYLKSWFSPTSKSVEYHFLPSLQLESKSFCCSFLFIALEIVYVLNFKRKKFICRENTKVGKNPAAPEGIIQLCCFFSVFFCWDKGSSRKCLLYQAPLPPLVLRFLHFKCVRCINIHHHDQIPWWCQVGGCWMSLAWKWQEEQRAGRSPQILPAGPGEMGKCESESMNVWEWKYECVKVKVSICESESMNVWK